MKISIVTPSYNQGAYFQRCIDSVRAESNGSFDLEHIILDNCSTDNTGALIERYQAEPGNVDLTVIVEKDKGQTYAINRGFELASGDIVCWLNTDEFYKPGVLAKVVEYFSSSPEVDVVFGDCEYVASDGKVLKEKREYFFSKTMLLYYGCFLPSCATFVRRRVVQEGTLLDPQFRVVMDFEWYVRMAVRGYRFAHLKETIAAFTWHDTNISSVHAERRAIERRLVQDMYGRIKAPEFLRGGIYKALFYTWIGVRILRRTVG